MSGLEKRPGCHPERSEGSRCPTSQILSAAKDDSHYLQMSDLRTHWIQGESNAVGLFREVTARAYSGSRMTIERFLLGLRRMEQQGIEVSQAATSVELTPRRAVGLMLRSIIDLTNEERVAFRQVCQIHPNTPFQVSPSWRMGSVPSLVPFSAI